ncbi:hypothetical protein SARC_08764 [Sphaeroforma arctica JP610]|uniref:Uncharacterized protein n=1 Tax=Sphaeroforma arctica JP610 TaxID=667725 RepID=A0A0L0FPS9_9EUKA|nr:hypothetical protein SARC_08764 [Sphaeroforma arctica JP610]KNC78815.1 hypothetical protein SARC_08764 [Sphaeroforma arctica JP610]|eukprot:XP_014152717.1 hypothetical protein SARC_08764 [Sphaeroforma arctica JP610]
MSIVAMSAEDKARVGVVSDAVTQVTQEFKGDNAAVNLLHDLMTSESTRLALQNLFSALGNEEGAIEKRDAWIEILVLMDGEETQGARKSLLNVVEFLQCARGTEEAKDFFECILSIGGLGQVEGAQAIVDALQDEMVHHALEGFANSLENPQKEKVTFAIDTVVCAFEEHRGSQSAAAKLSNVLTPMSEEEGMLSAILNQLEYNFEASGEDLINIAIKDPMNFSQKLIKQVLWPVLSERLNRIEVPDVSEKSGKDLYEVSDIVIHVTSMPKIIKIAIESEIELHVDDNNEIQNGGTYMVTTISANNIAARSDVMAFNIDKKSWPSFNSQGDLDVEIKQPGFDMTIGILVEQPPGDEDQAAQFAAGEVQCNLQSFNMNFHKNAKNEWLLNTASRWFNPALRKAIATAVSGQLKSLMNEAFVTFSKLLTAQQALVKRVKERKAEMVLAQAVELGQV